MSFRWKDGGASPYIVNRYAGVMRVGQRVLTGEPAIFASTGVLVDGQQRLMACQRMARGNWPDPRSGADADPAITQRR